MREFRPAIVSFIGKAHKLLLMFVLVLQNWLRCVVPLISCFWGILKVKVSSLTQSQHLVSFSEHFRETSWPCSSVEQTAPPHACPVFYVILSEGRRSALDRTCVIITRAVLPNRHISGSQYVFVKICINHTRVFWQQHLVNSSNSVLFICKAIDCLLLCLNAGGLSKKPGQVRDSRVSRTIHH